MTEEAEQRGVETLKKEEDYFEFIKNIRQAFPQGIVTDISPLYLSEPRGVYKNKSLHVIKPKSTKEVSECLKLATKYKIGVVPWSGGTGLVGGQIAPHKYYVTLSMERMNKIKNFSAVNQSIEVEAGVILEAIHEFVVEEMPVTVAVDVNGESVHRTGPAVWKEKIAEARLLKVT